MFCSLYNIVSVSSQEVPVKEEAMDTVPSQQPTKQQLAAQRQFRKTVDREGTPILKPYRR